MSKKKADSLGLKPLARIVGHCSAGRESEWFSIAPIDAVKKLFTKTGYSADKIDLFEINEAFSVQVIAAVKEFKLSMDKVNVNGGSVAIGHPIGGSGARILTTLLYAMQDRKAKTGLATLCIGGGEAAAMIVERV